MTRPSRPLLLAFALSVTAAVAYWIFSTSPVHIIGNVRVSALSSSLVRIEQKGPKGFEDRETFHVVGRKWPGVRMHEKIGDGTIMLVTDGYSVVVPADGESLEGVQILDATGKLLHHFGAAGESFADLPAPSKMPPIWLMPDQPRIVPAPWGATPAPPESTSASSGWDLENNARDVYAFITGPGRYDELRREFLALTGPVPLPPLYTFGYWTSRWHAYDEKEALAEIDTFRSRGIPLDLFVVDTDWRVGASDGYAVNHENFPDMQRFIDAAHARHVRLLFNDHPEPIAGALEPAELAYRWEGLTSLLKMGADAWWYDRNWHTVLTIPARGMTTETWGMRLYQDIARKFRPSQRPLIMSNVDGIRSAKKLRPGDPAAHRFPIWWTGDTYAEWSFLASAVKNSVDEGINNVLPYVNDDCGGHYMKDTPELFVRFMQFCSLSPVLRPHASQHLSRLPWDFDVETESIVRRYALFRYRLLPTIYAAARRAHDDGTPLLRRADLLWPSEPGAVDSTQYLLGDDLLVAPILEDRDGFATLPPEALAYDGKPGVNVDLYRGELGGELLAHGVPTTIAYQGRPSKMPVPEGIAGRWTTTWTVPEDGVWKLRLISDGSGKLFVDDQLVIDDTSAPNEVVASIKLAKGQKCALRVDVHSERRFVTAAVLVAPPSLHKDISERSVWIPPGSWEDVWTGQRHEGPARVGVKAALAQIPMFVRVGGIVLTTREMQFSSEAPWDPITADVYVPASSAHQTRELYEDDGESNAYLDGKSRRTRVELNADERGTRVTIHSAQGEFPGALLSRNWVIRLHLPRGAHGPIAVDGAPCSTCSVLRSTGNAEMPFEPVQGAGEVIEVKLDGVDARSTKVVELSR